MLRFDFVVAAMLVCLATSPAVADTYYVDDDAPSDPGPGDPLISDPDEDGSAAHPFDAIQEGIDDAEDGDEVVVCDGTYTGDGNRDLVVNQLAITVRSANGPDSCTIDCEGAGRGFRVINCRPALVTIEGFAIINGVATPIDDIDREPLNGGGVRSDNSYLTIRNCVTAGNTAEGGGGIYCGSSSVRIEGCTIVGNTASLYGGGVSAGFSTNLLLVDSLVVGNYAPYGGGVRCQTNDGRVLIINCLFSGNSAYAGGGILINCQQASVANCTVTGNSAAWGGGAEVWAVHSTFVNCTFDGNRASSGGGGIRLYSSQGSKTIANSILWGNSAPAGPQLHLTTGPAVLLIGYNDIQGGQDEVYVHPDTVLVWGDGNIDADPMFASPGYWDDNGTPQDPADDTWLDGDYHVLAGGPGIDAGSNSMIPQDGADLDGDGDILEPIPFDIDGTPRRTNDPATEDTGEGDAPIVDMGAYEYHSDCNGNGVPDYQDLADPDYEDLNENGILDVCETMLLAVADGDCIADQLVCRIWLSNAREPIVGGQFFLDYDESKLLLLSIEPGDSEESDPDNPFELEIFSYVDPTAGQIDYVVGIPHGPGGGTTNDVSMVVLTFDVLAGECQMGLYLDFRPSVFPYTTRLSGAVGHPVVPDPVDMGYVTLAAEPGDVTCDCLIDLEDMLRFCDCLSGPDNTYPDDCGRSDLDQDGDVDLSDVGLFQIAFTGVQ